MGVAKGIRKLGFRSWHERELLLGFGWMAILLLCAIVAFAALETLITSDSAVSHVKSATVILASGAVGIIGLQRFVAALAQVQSAASQAVCKQCKEFGRLRVVADDTAGTWLRVSCRGCAYEWVMDLSLSEGQSIHSADAQAEEAAPTAENCQDRSK